MFSSIKKLWENLTSCKIDMYFNRLEVSMDQIITRCNRIEKALEKDIKMLTEEVAKYKGILHSVAEALPDMLWCKDLDGRYMYANTAIKRGLLFDKDPIGKTDKELANKAKELYGDENHTFGEKCANSDKIVLNTMLSQRFLESGKIQGEMVYLEVFKAPLYIDGELRGVVGTGRNMTEYVRAFRENNCKDCKKMDDIFKKYEYEG